MQKDQSACQYTVQAAEERLLAALDQIEILHEQVDFWRTLVKSSNQVLQAVEQELQETQQELVYTSNDLCDALMFQTLELDKAQEFAKQILTSQKSTIESLAELLTVIYKAKVKREDLEQIDKLDIRTKPSRNVNNQIIANSRQIADKSKRLQAQYKELGFKFITFKALVKELNEHFTKMTANLEDENDVLPGDVESSSSSSPPPLIYTHYKTY